MDVLTAHMDERNNAVEDHFDLVHSYIDEVDARLEVIMTQLSLLSNAIA